MSTIELGFAPALLPLVQRGIKTETRRLFHFAYHHEWAHTVCAAGDGSLIAWWGYPRADGDLAAFTRANYPDGGITLPAQTGDELVTPVGTYHLVRVTVERLHQIDNDALAREGFESVGSFVAFWDSYYGDRPWATWAANPWVVVYQWTY